MPPKNQGDRRGNRLKGRIANYLELPKDVVLDLPRLTVLGNLQLAIENHRGLMEYTPQKVVVAVSGGQIEVEGSELAIGSIAEEEITLTGQIEKLNFLR